MLNKLLNTFQNKDKLQFLKDITKQNYPFVYQTHINSPYLKDLKRDYNLEDLIKSESTDLEIVITLLNWVNKRWSHNGQNTPSFPSSITILKEANEGAKFRCVEYAIVLRSVLACFGFYSRTVGLKIKYVENTLQGAGHMVSEVWLPMLNKWIMLDAQFNIIPSHNNIPLNCVELQKAIESNKSINLINKDGLLPQKKIEKYTEFIFKYLYHFDLRFDQREKKTNDLKIYNGKTSLMLLPVGAKEPKIFQCLKKMDYFIYTNSVKDFYINPNE
jgi:hypothetical protein